MKWLVFALVLTIAPAVSASPPLDLGLAGTEPLDLGLAAVGPPAAGIDGFEAEGARGRTDPPPASTRPKYDPYKFKNYVALVKHVENGLPAVLFIGVPDTAVGTYESHLWVPSGFGGHADGVYDCYLDKTSGKLMMTRRPDPMPVPVVPAAPFVQAPVPPVAAGAVTSTRTISATSAVASSRSSVGFSPTGNTFTGAPVGMFGNTNPFGSVPCGPTG